MKYLVGYIDKEEEILRKIIAHEGFPLEYEQCKINPKAFKLTTWVKDYDAKPFFDIWWGETLKPVDTSITISNVVVKCRGGGESHQGRWLGVEVSPESKLEILMNLPEIPVIKNIMATPWSKEMKALFTRAGW